jgi:hypothetical protein
MAWVRGRKRKVEMELLPSKRIPAILLEVTKVRNAVVLGLPVLRTGTPTFSEILLPKSGSERALICAFR